MCQHPTHGINVSMKKRFCVRRILANFIIKSLIETSIVVLTFAAWFPIENAVSGFKREQRP